MLQRGMPLSRPAAFALCVQATAPLSPLTPTSTDLPQPVPASTSQHQTVPDSARQCQTVPDSAGQHEPTSVGTCQRRRSFRPAPTASLPAHPIFAQSSSGLSGFVPLIYVAATCRCTPLHTAVHYCTPPHAARCSPLPSPRQAVPGPRQLSGPRPLWRPPVPPPGTKVKPPLFPYKPVSHPVPPVSASLRTEIHRCRPPAPGQPLSAALLSHPLYLDRSAATATTATTAAAAITAAVPAPPAIQRPPPTRSALLSPYRPSPPPPPGCYPPPKSPKATQIRPKVAQKPPQNRPGPRDAPTHQGPLRLSS